MRRLSWVAALAACLTVGCASSSGSYRVLTFPDDPASLDAYRTLDVEVIPRPGVGIFTADASRLAALVMTNARTKLAKQYDQMTLGRAGGLVARVTVSKYDAGNAFARGMLAGLGAMEIVGQLELLEPTQNTCLASFKVSKTFAWGGAYGASTTILDIEDGFAQAVVDAIAHRGRPAGRSKR